MKVEEGAANETEVDALPYVLALQAFCIVDPTLCTPVTDPSQFVVTLQPYLKNQVSMGFLLLNFRLPSPPVRITLGLLHELLCFSDHFRSEENECLASIRKNV